MGLSFECAQGLDPRYVVEIDLYRTLEKCLAWLTGQADVCGPLTDPEQIRMTDIKADSIANDNPEWFEWVLSQAVAEFFGGHTNGSSGYLLVVVLYQ